MMITMIFYVWIFLSIFLESFPISSSGHLLLFESLVRSCNYFDVLVIPSYLDHFLFIPFIILLPLFFYQQWLPLLSAFPRSLPIIKKMLALGFITELCTASFYGLFALSGVAWFPLWLGFACTTALLFSLRWCPIDRHAVWNLRRAVALGMVQGLALLPGISRFASTFTVARWCGFAPMKAFSLSFLIAWPLSAAACLKGAVHLYSKGILQQLLNLQVCLVMLVASGCAYLGFCCVRRMIKNNTVWWFGWYMLMITILTMML